MANGNGRVNCILAVCCPGGSEAQRQAVTDQIVEDTKVEAEYARVCADWIIENFDLAPKGSLELFKAEVARLARQPQTPPGKNK